MSTGTNRRCQSGRRNGKLCEAFVASDITSLSNMRFDGAFTFQDAQHHEPQRVGQEEHPDGRNTVGQHAAEEHKSCPRSGGQSEHRADYLSLKVSR